MRIETVFPPDIINNKSDIQVTIYMQTHRTAPENKADKIQFKNLRNQALDKIANKAVREKIEEKLNSIYTDDNFWIHNLDGLAVLVTEDDMAVYRIQRKVENQVSVESNFDLRVLLRHFQSDDEYFVLGLSKEYFRVYKANRYSVEEYDFDEDLEMTKDEVLGTEVEGRTLNVGNYGGADGANYHGHNAKSEEDKIDRQRYFLYIDRFIQEHLDNPNNRPIILLGLTEHLGEFRKISNNPLILADGIEVSLESVEDDMNALLSKTWDTIEPIFLEKTSKLLERYNVAKQSEMASSDVSEVANALIEGRVDTLVLEDNKSFTNDYSFLSDYSKDADVINIFLQLASKTKTEIIVLPKEKMPSDSGVFAIYRYLSI